MRRFLDMRKMITVDDIEKAIEKLTPHDRLKLVERVVHQLRSTVLAPEKELDWSKLYGAGKGLWKGVDAQEFVNLLREEWE